MPDLHSVLLIAVTAVVTALLRFLPFWLFRGREKTPAAITYLSRVLPAAVMAMLVVYCLRGVSFAAVGGWLPYLIACGVTALLYIWRRSTLFSIIAGTVSYMLLVQLVF